jgi:uncharacterized membrane protein
MKPLLVLAVTFGVALAATYFLGQHPDYRLSGLIAMATMLVFTGVAHFPFRAGMAQMLPAWLPAKNAWVLGTGLLEIAAAVGLLLPALRPLTAGCLLVFFALILPANIRAAQLHLDYQRGTPDGPGLRYLWFRVPLQLFFMAWTWYFGLHLSAA